jgi:hypothetical protein
MNQKKKINVMERETGKRRYLSTENEERRMDRRRK